MNYRSSLNKKNSKNLEVTKSIFNSNGWEKLFADKNFFYGRLHFDLFWKEDVWKLISQAFPIKINDSEEVKLIKWEVSEKKVPADYRYKKIDSCSIAEIFLHLEHISYYPVTMSEKKIGLAPLEVPLSYFNSSILLEEKISSWLRSSFGKKIAVLSIRKESEQEKIFVLCCPSAQLRKKKDEICSVEISIVFKKVDDKSDKEEVFYRVTKCKIKKKEKIFFFFLPLIDQFGRFLINNNYRVITPQLVRSPGLVCNREENGDVSCDLIPEFGNWIEFKVTREVDSSGQSSPSFKMRSYGGKYFPVANLMRLMGVNKNSAEQFITKKDVVNGYDGDWGKSEDDQRAERFIRRFLVAKSSADSLLHYPSFLFGSFWRKKLVDKFYGQLIGRHLFEDIRLKKEKTIVSKGYFLDRNEVKEISKKIGEVENVQEIVVHTKSNKKWGIISSNLVFKKWVVLGESEIEGNQSMNKMDIILPVSLSHSDDGQGINSFNLLSLGDILCAFSYMKNVFYGFVPNDDIDDLENRRLRTVRELLMHEFRYGLNEIIQNTLKRSEEEFKMKEIRSFLVAKISGFVSSKPLIGRIATFFKNFHLSQFLDQNNPLSEVSHSRKVTSLGPGGLSKKTAKIETRDIRSSYYGRICPAETPEGTDIGLVLNLSSSAIVDDRGQIRSPYWRVVDGKLKSGEISYLSAAEEKNFVIGEIDAFFSKVRSLLSEKDIISARCGGNYIQAKRRLLDYIDSSYYHILSLSSGCIPFVEHDDASRVLMAANMLKQAVPVIKREEAVIGTRIENVIAEKTSFNVRSLIGGKVAWVDSCKIVVESPKKRRYVHNLASFVRTNQNIGFVHFPAVTVGQVVKKNQIIAEGSGVKNGVLALGHNLTVAFLNFQGYNYEDSVVVSERLVREDLYTSVHIFEYTVERLKTADGDEEFTRDIPNVSDKEISNLDENGFVMIGTYVKEDDILIGKITPKKQLSDKHLESEERFILKHFGEYINVSDSSLRLPKRTEGIVQRIKIERAGGYWGSGDWPADCLEIVKVYIAQKRRIAVGDKIAGRHGNKGIISKIVPIEDMPFSGDGRKIDIILNPLSIPSRMNIGQVFEAWLASLASLAGERLIVDPFSKLQLKKIVKEVVSKVNIRRKGNFEKNLNSTKDKIFDGRTGEVIGDTDCLGILYVIKLYHMVEDKIHARNIGGYKLINQQPLGGKAKGGGMRSGEMETWAFEAHEAWSNLQEMLTVKSDDVVARQQFYSNIIKGVPLERDNLISGTFSILLNEIKSLALDMKVRYDKSDWKKKEKLERSSKEDRDEDGDSGDSENDLEKK